jgi:hypothetical protein
MRLFGKRGGQVKSNPHVDLGELFGRILSLQPSLAV